MKITESVFISYFIFNQWAPHNECIYGALLCVHLDVCIWYKRIHTTSGHQMEQSGVKTFKSIKINDHWMRRAYVFKHVKYHLNVAEHPTKGKTVYTKELLIKKSKREKKKKEEMNSVKWLVRLGLCDAANKTVNWCPFYYMYHHTHTHTQHTLHVTHFYPILSIFDPYKLINFMFRKYMHVACAVCILFGKIFYFPLCVCIV